MSKSTFVVIAVVVAGAVGGAMWYSRHHRGETEQTGVAAMQVPAGFTVEKVAGSDLVSYPMLGTFDPDGRLFLCESSGNTLKNEEMKANPDYQIRMLEDRDGDGKFDHSQVFASKLTLPAGAVWYRHSLYVASPPDLLRFEDTNGDGVADVREVVVTGWNMSSNAASLHGPFFGPDGWLYLTDGRHGFDIKAKDGREYKGKASRIWRVRPDGTGLEWLAGGGFDNPVEVTFTPAGETIGTMTYFKDPENGERDALLHYVEGGVYPKWYSVVSEFQRTGDLMPVMTKFARIAPSGLLRYRSPAFGDSYQGNLFTAQFNPHRVQRHIVSREAASFRTEDSDFLTSTDPDFHPTDVLEDADGSLVVVDTGGWFIHGCPISRVAKPEVKGALYRIRREGAQPPSDPWGKSLNIAGMSAEGRAKLLEDPRPAVRDRALEAMVEQQNASVSALAAFRNASANPEARAAAVFALYRIGSPEALTAIRAALQDADFQVRTAAARCAGMSRDTAAVPRLMEMARADHPVCRRQAIAALGQIGDVQAVPALLAAAVNPEDRFVEHSTIYSLITLNQPALVSRDLNHSDPKVRKAALIALDQMEAGHLRKEQIAPLIASPDHDLRSAALWVVSHHPDWAGVAVSYLNNRLRNPVAGEMASAGEVLVALSENPAIQELIGGLLKDPKLPEQSVLVLLDTLEGVPVKTYPLSWTSALAVRLKSPNEGVRTQTVDLIRSRNLEGFDADLDAIARDSNSPVGLRISALEVLATRENGLNAERFDFLTSRLKPGTDAVIRQSAARVLGRCKLSESQLLALAKDYLPKSDPLILSTVLDSFRASHDEQVGKALIAVLQSSPSALGTLGEDRLKTLLAGYPQPVQDSSAPLFQRLKDAQKERIDRLQKLEPLLAAGGDVGRGRKLFFGDKVACSSCHTIGTEGAKVGPDLTGIGALRSGHDLLEAVVFPSASFVPGHEVYNVDTETERLSGVIRSSSPDAVVLVTGPKGEIRIPRKSIKSMQPSTVSLMPEGFDETLSKTELTDLLAFLQAEKSRPKMASSATNRP